MNVGVMWRLLEEPEELIKRTPTTECVQCAIISTSPPSPDLTLSLTSFALVRVKVMQDKERKRERDSTPLLYFTLPICFAGSKRKNGDNSNIFGLNERERA